MKMSFQRKIVLLFFAVINIIHVDGSEITIKKGILDLRGVNLIYLNEIEFEGSWEFYWNQLLLPENFAADTQPPLTGYIKVPSVWRNFKVDGKKLPGQGFATYRLKVFLDQAKQNMAISIGSNGTAHNIFVDGKLISKAGVVSKDAKLGIPGYRPGVYAFTPDTNTFDIIVQISNYHYCKGGLWNNMNRLGTIKEVQRSWNMRKDKSLIISGAVFILIISYFGLYLINRSLKSSLFFSLFAIVILARTLVVNETYILELFPGFNWNVLVKIEFLTLVLGTVTFSCYMYHIFKGVFSFKILKLIILVGGVFSSIIIFTKPLIFTDYLLYYEGFIVIASFYAFYVISKAFKQNNKRAYIFLVGFVVLITAVFNDILYTSKVVNTLFLTSYGFLFFILSQSFLIAYSYSQMFVSSIRLANKLEIMNTNLEKTVEQRTNKIRIQNKALVNQKTALEQKNEEIETQRDNLVKQHELVSLQKKQITSSIQYASRIQDALMDLTNEESKVAPNRFIFYKPKDIVSGDFYWFKEIRLNGQLYKMFGVVDCTGHGVPGAFMSILGISLLNEIIAEFTESISAAHILNRMRQEVKQKLQHHDSEKAVKDGMDMALCILNYEQMELQFSGAYNPLYLVRGGELQIFKGDRMPIGSYFNEKESFTNHQIKIENGDNLYVFSDGFLDQFGGMNYEKYNSTRFKNLITSIASKDMNAQRIAMEKALSNWMSETIQIDDITVVGVKV